MPSYLIESYASGSPAVLADARGRARRTAELGAGIRYLRTTFIPRDEIVLHFFEAPSLDALDVAGRLAALPFERIVEAVDETAQHSEEE